MAMLCTEDDDLVLRLSRLEQVGALHGDIRVPLSAVDDLQISERPFGELRGIRAPGTALPRRIALGSWRHRRGKDFAALYRGRPAIIVRLRGAPFQRLLVCAEDAEACLTAIQARLARAPA